MSSPTNEQIRMLAVAEHAALTDVGLAREHNEDSHFVRLPLFVVADGMGGANAGEVASGIVVETMEKESGDGEMPGALGSAIQDANARIYEMAQSDRDLAGMGTTTTAAWFGGATLTLAHVGDSRAYRFRGDRLEQISEDHSLVGGLVRMGKLTPAEAMVHPQRSVILRAVGVEPSVEVDVTEHELEDGDVYLIASDGLDSMVRDEVIEETLRACPDLQEAAQMLVDLANASGGHDNITVLLVRVARA